MAAHGTPRAGLQARGDYYAAGQHTPDGGYVWHLDIWNFHCDGETWKLDTRQIPVRYKQPGQRFRAETF